MVDGGALSCIVYFVLSCLVLCCLVLCYMRWDAMRWDAMELVQILIIITSSVSNQRMDPPINNECDPSISMMMRSFQK